MKYKTVEIKPTIDNEWHCTIYPMKYDRIKGKRPKPVPMGFFHYWVTIPDKQAFEELKQCMIDAHEDSIRRTQMSLDKLRKLEYKKK